jgi:hypothetical protein
MRSTVSFRVSRDDHLGTAITPVVDGRPLTELVADLEVGRGYEPAGGYDALVPRGMGDLTRYYLGQENGQWPMPGSVWLLGCACGEAGCWPLKARVSVRPDTVTWTDFSQPYRDGWDYSDLGPFVFERDQYEQAVRSAVAELGA